jgi:hypothetical protein
VFYIYTFFVTGDDGAPNFFRREISCRCWSSAAADNSFLYCAPPGERECVCYRPVKSRDPFDSFNAVRAVLFLVWNCFSQGDGINCCEIKFVKNYY